MDTSVHTLVGFYLNNTTNVRLIPTQCRSYRHHRLRIGVEQGAWVGAAPSAMNRASRLSPWHPISNITRPRVPEPKISPWRRVLLPRGSAKFEWVFPAWGVVRVTWPQLSFSYVSVVLGRWLSVRTVIYIVLTICVDTARDTNDALTVNDICRRVAIRRVVSSASRVLRNLRRAPACRTS